MLSARLDAVVRLGRGARHGYPGGIDWTIAHLLNTTVATRDWLEDPVTGVAAVIVPLYAVATASLWLLARPGGSPRWKLASASALGSATVALLANQVVSHLWERPRPFTTHAAATHLLAPASVDPSFPSDHAAAAFAIAFAVLAFSRPVGRVLLAVATMIALSRVALGLHYPSDVLAGALVGWASALLVTSAGRVPIVRLVRLAERLTDPVLGRIHLLASSRWRRAA